MRRRLAWLLAVCMAVQLPLTTVYAEEQKAPDAHVAIESEQEAPGQGTKAPDKVGEENGRTASDSNQVKAEPEPAKEDTTDAAQKDNHGALSIEMISTLPIADIQSRLQKVSAVLTKEGTEVARESFTSADNAQGRAFAELKDLAPGTYKVQVAGGGFTYLQDIDIQSSNQQIKLVDMTTVIDMNQAHPGTFGYGDVNGDGVLDDTDRSLLLEALNSKSEDLTYDVNGDGTVDLADLQCFSYSYGCQFADASVARSVLIDEEKVEAQVGAGTELAQGTRVSDILTGKGSISVKPASDEAISDTNPVEISIDLSRQNTAEVGGITIAPPVGSENIIKAGAVDIVYTDDNGDEQTMTVPIGGIAAYSRAATAATVTQEPDGTVVINLGSQIAVKKITIKVTDTGSTKLADIAKVEFLNDMESRIPAPVMNIPEKLSVKPANKEFTVTWDAQQNVAGYEVEIKHKEKTIVLSASNNRIKVTSFGNEKLKNKETYKVRVQSVNGEWSSGYSESIDAVPKADKPPYPPENISITGGYRLLNISWKKMEDTDYYTLYYRAKGQSDYQKVDKITATNYRLTALENKTAYEVCLTGTNECGTSPKSIVYTGKTMDLDPAVTSNYKLINTDNGVGNATAHIEKVEYPSNKPENPFTVVDSDYASSWIFPSWDAGGYNAGKPSPIVEFDQPYEMNRITVVPDAGQVGQYGYVKTRYWDANGKVTMIDGFMTPKTSINGKQYYELWFNKPFTAKKVQVNMAQYWVGNNSVSISEMKFYHYDSIEDDVEALYADDMHVTLADGVTKEQLDALETRANTKDEVSGEYHPRRELLLREIENAKDILQDKGLSDSIQVDTSIINSRDNVLKFAYGLNSWQPLGISAYEGEELAVYVGRENTAAGAKTQLRLIATQYHAESGSWNKVVVSNLSQGKNIVTIPKISSLDTEHGGSLYVEYTGDKSNINIRVRVSGGHKIPMLDVSKAANDTDKRTKIEAYVKELNSYVPTIKDLHNSYQNQEGSLSDYAYDKQNCILGATEIVLDNMMYSVSAEQILSGINSRVKSKGQAVTVENQTEALYQSIMAMDQMIDLFYQHKGLSKGSVPEKYGANNRYPVSRLNIRYMRMFGGAFMYAGGLHIGIEWGSVPGLATSQPVVSDNGKYVSGQFFGWGIAHEIGHVINQPDYAIAEITNNYFSVLSQADETNKGVRFSYKDVYEKVTSGTKGRAADVFTSLGMYWQLHLAYDNGYNFKTYDNYTDQFNNLFFARVDAYARNTKIAPNGLSLGGADTDNKLMRLSCAAAEKNLLPFFEKWGMTPNGETKAYAAKFPEEERNICYITDEARVYRIEGGNNAAVGSTVNAQLEHQGNSKQVTLKLSNTAADQNAMLGYEIYRNGKVVGFVEAKSGETKFTDTIATVNNRVFTYEVIGYDKLLNKTEKVALNPLKISHDGSVSKKLWNVTTNMVSPDDVMEEGSNDIPEPESISAITKVYNDDYNDSYIGTARNNAQMVIDFNESLAVCGMKIVVPKDSADAIKNFEVYISKDKKDWTLAKSGTLSYDNGIATVYFSKENDSWMYTYDATYMKLVAKGQKKAEITEIDVLGPAGDNVELLENGIGILKSDYVYDKNLADGKIPAGSLIFTGEYKGNPAYNAVKLYNQKGEIIEGSQLIFAVVPEKGELGEISSGTWIYYIEPDALNELTASGNLPESVRAELYRVDDAHTNEGERLVSDTLSVALPEPLPEIEIQDNK